MSPHGTDPTSFFVLFLVDHGCAVILSWTPKKADSNLARLTPLMIKECLSSEMVFTPCLFTHPYVNTLGATKPTQPVANPKLVLADCVALNSQTPWA